jgi:alkylhydroperoxidase family enzyme
MPEPMPKVAGLPGNAPIPPADMLSDSLSTALAPRVARLGYLGGFFAVCARQPDALESFVAFTESLKRSVPGDLTEIVALCVATLLENEYEHAQHVALCRRTGMSEDWIRAVTAGDVTSSRLTPQQRAVLRLSAAVVRNAGHRSREELEAVITECGPDLAVGIVLLIARYIAHAHAANLFGLVDPFCAGTSEGSS